MFQPHSCWLIRSPCLWWQEVRFGTAQKGSLSRAWLQNAGFGKVSYPHLEVQKPIFFETSIWCPTLQGTIPLQGTTPVCFQRFTIILYGKRHLQHSHQLPHRPKIQKDLKTIAPQIKSTNWNSKNRSLAVQMILGAPKLKEIGSGRLKIWKAAAQRGGAAAATLSGHEKNQGKYRCIPIITLISTYTYMYI